MPFIFLAPLQDKSNATVFAIITVIIPFVVFFLIRKLAVSNCVAKLSQTYVEFELSNGISEKINFKDLSSYKIDFTKNGPILALKFEDKRFKILANNNICNATEFRKFCDELELEIENYKKENHADILKVFSFFNPKGKTLFSN